MSNDQIFMNRALKLAQGQMGKTGDNPAVGCVLVKDRKIIGEGATAKGGRPHAEIMALNNCQQRGQSAKGAVAYVTLEPCAHQGRSGPCVEALIEAQISRCVVALIDPNPQVNWQGLALMQEAGIDTYLGPGEAMAREIMSDFLARFE